MERRIDLDAMADGLIGESPAFREALRFIPIFAASTAPVLLTGETGTGKELFARAIHYRSARKSRPFVPLNCGAIPDTLLENELFGHQSGAYTGAGHAQDGLVTLAHGGTLFLDEFDCLSPSAQAKLLRLLQDGEYRPLGSAKLVRADIRVITATNADVAGLVASRRIREDLFHRVNVLPLSIPPLRARGSDVILLARHFLDLFARQYERGGLCFTADAESSMRSQPWPGNVRELQAAVHRSVVMTSGPVITSLGAPDPPSASRKPPESAPPPDRFDEAKQRAVNEFERGYLSDMLSRFAGNVSRAARQAGKERRSFQRLLSKHGIDRNLYAR